MTSNQEHADELYSENLAQEVTRGMREAAFRVFWMSNFAPFGFRSEIGGKKRPKLELNKATVPIVRRIFGMALRGKAVLDIAKILNAEGIPSSGGKGGSRRAFTRPCSTRHMPARGGQCQGRSVAREARGCFSRHREQRGV